MLCVVLCSLSSAPKTNSSFQSPVGKTEGAADCQYVHIYIKHRRLMRVQKRHHGDKSNYKLVHDKTFKNKTKQKPAEIS